MRMLIPFLFVALAWEGALAPRAGAVDFLVRAGDSGQLVVRTTCPSRAFLGAVSRGVGGVSEPICFDYKGRCGFVIPAMPEGTRPALHSFLMLCARTFRAEVAGAWNAAITFGETEYGSGSSWRPLDDLHLVYQVEP